MNYFQNCLTVLDLEEEVALTDEALRVAYRKAALKAHPDKGGNEQKFEAVTRAYAYLTEILRRIKGGRAKEGVVEAPTTLKDSRQKDAKQWETIEPVRLNPKKLDMNAFNQMYEQTRMPDPDDQGYGDWLKSEDPADKTTKFSGKFNRDVFHRTFEEEAKKKGASTALQNVIPQAMVLAPTHGVELGRGAAATYTAPANIRIFARPIRQRIHLAIRYRMFAWTLGISICIHRPVKKHRILLQIPSWKQYSRWSNMKISANHRGAEGRRRSWSNRTNIFDA
jgi:curved DNA-binding protein CbpA